MVCQNSDMLEKYPRYSEMQMRLQKGFWYQKQEGKISVELNNYGYFFNFSEFWKESQLSCEMFEFFATILVLVPIMNNCV